MKRSKHLCFLLVLYVLVVHSLAEDFTLNINFDKPIFVTDDKFLSLTVDPAILLAGSALSDDFEKSVNLAKAMAPAYIRLGGPSSTYFRFTNSTGQDNKDKITVLSESDWNLIHRWAKKTKLNVISCIRPDDQRDKIHDTEYTTEIISFSDRMAFNGSWQLGYECQTGCNIPAGDLARQTLKLRKILNEFPRYSNSLVTGPDVVDYRSEKQRQYLKDYFDIAAPVLSAITWHPNFASVTLDDEGAFIHQDDLEKEKEELLKVIGPFIDKQPLWIAESKPEDYKNLYVGALILARRLGNAAKSKINVLMRQPTDITQPSPDYWVSLLHKTLVGTKVFDANVRTSDKNHIHLYCQCTKRSNMYDKGSVTIFGVNLDPEEAIVNLKGIRSIMVHEYVLSPGFDAPNRMFSESVLLNNRTLDLINDGVPEFYPVISIDPEGLQLELQPGGIGFWVLPDLKVEACMEDDGTPEVDASSSFNVFEDSGSVEDVKIQIVRSVPDRSTTETEKREKTASPITRKSILQRELRKLRKFTKKRLDEYDTAKNPSKPNDSTTSEPEDAGDKPESRQESEKLQEFKNRILQIRSTPALDKMKPRINNIITRVTSLLSRVQNTLESMRPDADKSNKMVSSSNVRNSLKSLYDFLNRVNLNEPVNRIMKGQRPRLFKRDLYDTIQEPMNRKWKNPPRKRFEGDDLRIAENVGQIVRPHVVEWKNSDSDEHTFYGFFKMDPAEGFPEGDVFLTAEDLPEAKNSRTAGQQTDVRFSGSDYVNPEDLWTEDEDDYPFYGPNESFANSRTLDDKDRVGSKSFAELWEAETFVPRKNVQLGDEYNLKRIPNTQDTIDFQGYDRFIDGQSSNRKANYEKRHSFDRRIDQKRRMSDDNQSPIFEPLDFSIGSDYDGYGRFKRDVKDLHTILDQEMIKEDDANSKDCNCRVIRSPRTCNCRTKRGTTESAESATVSEVESLNSHDMADVEVFAELKGEPREAVESRTESSNVKAGQNRPGSTSVNLKTLGSATPPVVSSSSLGSNKNGRGEGSTSFGEKSRKGVKHVANLDLETVPSERIEVTSANLEDFNSEMEVTVTSSSLSVKEDDRSLETPIQHEGDTFSRVESRDGEGQITKSDLEAIPSVTSANFGNFDTETPILIPSMILTSNEDSQLSEIPIIQREVITSSHEKSQQNEGQIATTDLERIPSETVSADSMNLENLNSESPTLATSLTLASNEEGQLSEMPNQRGESTFNDQESGENEGESSSSDLDIIPVGAASINFEYYNPETPISASPLTLTANEDVESIRSSRTPVRRQGRKFFLKKSRQNEAEKSTVSAPQDSTRYSSSNWELSTPSTNVAAVQEEAEEDSSTTFKSATLWEQDIAKESEMDSEVDQTAVASSKRQVVGGQIPKLSETTAADPLSKDSRRIGKQRQNLSSKKTKSNVAKARELQLMRRARVLSALSKMIRGKTGDAVYKFRSKPKAKDRVGEPLKNSEKQESREKSRERRKIVFQKFQESVADEMDEMDEMDDEKRNLKRREAWEMIDDTDDLEDEMDCEKLACVLVYKPTKNDNNESYESIEKRDAPETEVVRSRNVRERVFNPKNQRNYHDSIMEHSDPHGVRTEIVELKDLYDSETSRIDEDDEDDEYDDKTYFALVENLDKPRIFRLREKEQDGKRSVQISPYPDFSDDFYDDQPRNRAYRTNFKNPNGKEIYIIDPSEYRGGEPILKPYKRVEAISRPSKSRSNSRSKTVHEAIRKILRRPQKIHKTERKREDKIETSTEPEELSEDANTGELLKVLIDNLDLQSVEQHFRQLEKYNTIEEKRNYIRSIVDDMKKKRSEEGVDRAGFESMENSKENESVEMIDLTETMDTGSNEDDTSVEVSLVQEYSGEETRARRRRDTINESKDDYLKWLKSSFLHKTLSKVQNTEQGNDLLLKEDSEDNFNEDSSKILQVLKDNEVVKNIQNNLDDLSSVRMDKSSSNMLVKPETLKMFPWVKQFGRFRRQAVEDEGKINENTDMVKPSEVLQRLEESSSPKIQPLAEIDDIEKSLIEKKPIERYAKTENQKKDNVHGLPSFIQQSIPSLQNVVIDGLQKAQNFTGSVERLIENLEENSNETTNNEQEKNWVDSKSNATTHVFHNAIINVKKFFALLGGITRILRG